MSSDIMEQMRVAFRAEALDLLIELDSALLALEAEPDDSTLVHRVFRAIHTIKGSGATAGFAHVAGFAHRMEEAFDLAREGRLAVTPELIDCGLKACDVLRLIIEEKAEGAAVPGEEEVTGAFTRLLPVSDSTGTDRTEPPKPNAATRSAFEIVFKPGRGIFYSGADPVTLLNDLRELGQAHVTAHADQVPPLPSLEAEHCYLWWEILLVTDRDHATVKDVFVFVEDECEVRIRLLEDQGAAVALLGSVPAEVFELFGAECEDHLEGIERDALALEQDPASRDYLDDLFRGVHSIKGNAGLLLGHVKGAALVDSHPLQLLLRVTHGLESVLDPFRGANAGPVPEATIQTALETCDAIRTLLGSLTQKGAGGPLSPELLERLGVRTSAASAQAVEGRAAAFHNTTSQCLEMMEGCFRRMESDAESPGPVLETWLRGLRTLMAAARYQNCPELEEPVAQQLRILDASMSTGAPLSGEERAVLGDAFRSARSILDRISPRSEVSRAPVSADPAPAKAPADRPGASASPSTIRIDQNKLDRLMRVVGELLVARGAFPLLAGKLNAGADATGVAKELKESGANISRIADELQDSVMSIRMLPARTVFQKFPRLVRDLARSLGKEVRLVIEGEGIELDKTILEQIGDPLVHVIRNAVDHGLEPPDERQAMGKDASGQLILRAVHEAGGVVIEITDDGRGLDAGALRRKAVEKGLLTPEAAAALSDEAAFQLVFLPGLTTAAKVSDVSGRGVGMDVVRSNVRNLHGAIEIRSKRGRGTTFLIRLPTSLMISKGILLEAGAEEYILPLSSIRDMVKVPPEEAHEYRGLTLAQVRGNVYPLFTLAEMLGRAAAKTPELSIAIVNAGAVVYGLVVDKFLCEVEVLVKPLTGGLEQCREFQGAAIMGDGRVVLVLNALECHNLAGAACN
ncbi:MAG: chemotaxis protein CheA [Bryobacteraceae bacterium]|jgi:two-component system chemotaxis sensor kinase CheA